MLQFSFSFAGSFTSLLMCFIIAAGALLRAIFSYLTITSFLFQVLLDLWCDRHGKNNASYLQTFRKRAVFAAILQVPISEMLDVAFYAALVYGLILIVLRVSQRCGACIPHVRQCRAITSMIFCNAVALACAVCGCRGCAVAYGCLAAAAVSILGEQFL